MTHREGAVDRGFRYGIEHETALLRPDGRFADFTNTTFEELQAIVDLLPLYEKDYPGLCVGDQAIKLKRWYVEGFERFGPTGEFLRCDPKGIETRTPIRETIGSAIAQLEADFRLLGCRALDLGFRPIGISHNPQRPFYRVEPELNDWERDHRCASPEDRTAYLHMTTFGPDLNLSWSLLGDPELVDVGAKLTYYSPYIVPFSFSSPFYEGKLWGGLSVRTHIRTGVRPAALVFVRSPSSMISSDPSLTQLPRVEAEAGRIEFKAFDTCPDLTLYADLLTLVKGMVIEERLDGRRLIPDAALHQMSARAGFDDPEIRAGARTVLRSAEAALSDPEDLKRIRRLWRRLDSRSCPARRMIERYKAGEEVAGLQRA